MRHLVFGIAVAVVSLMTAQGMADDQQIADFIKSRLQVEQTRGNLRGFNVDMRVDRGTVWFKGYVSSNAQEQLILRTAQKAGHLGVVQVVDDIEIQSSQAQVADYRQPTAAPKQQPYQLSAYQQPQMQQQQPMAQPSQAMRSAGFRAPQDYGSGIGSNVIMPPAADFGGVPQAQSMGMGTYTDSTPLPFANSSMAPMEPMQGGGVPAMSASYSQPPMAAGYGDAGGGMGGAPNMPGYAWPGYAAHPNYGAVSYPKQYSPSAWPYIGPFYPYPQVPLGWRKVALEWDDGWWFLDFHDK